MELWERFVVVGCVVLASLLLAKLVDLRMSRAKLEPGAATRYRVLRRAISAGIVFVALMSALLVIPQVRAMAGGILASSALLGLVVGFAAQRTLSNLVAGIMIAFTQPLRLGDRVEVGGVEGIVEEIALTYTYIRTDENTRLVIPNEKLASDTIKNSTIVDRAQRAEITVQIPITADLGAALDVLRDEVKDEREADVFVSALDGNARITVRVLTAHGADAVALERELRVRAHARLRSAGVFG